MVKTTSKKTKTEAPAEGEIVDSKALVVQDPEAVPTEPKKAARVKRDSAMSIVGNVTTAQLKQALDVQTEQRKLIEEFIKAHLREGTDYGRIHVVKSCQAEEKQRGSCDRDYHYSKSILFKPGQEKIFSLFSITDKIEKDLEAYEMLPGVTGLVAFKCTMFQKGKVIGEGRGAATLASERSDPNSTLKKAEKRARMDACLSLGFSEYFTQDLDDPDYAAQREMANSKAAAEAERRDKDEFGLMPRDPDTPIDNSERAVLHRIILKAGFSEQDEILELLRVNGITDPSVMTSGQARELMGKVAHGMFASPQIQVDDPEPEAPAEPEVVLPPEPELEIDDDFREAIQARVNTIGLTARGQMWLLSRSIGKPYAKWDTLKDEHFRKLHDVLTAIEDGHIQVEDHYVKGFVERLPDPELGEDGNIKPAGEQESLLEEEDAGAKNGKA
jgi:hypothetical protein